MKVLGIDPGVNGGIALIDSLSGDLMKVWPMPLVELIRANGKRKRRVDALGLFRILREARPERAYVELVNASPGMGVVSAFSFGHGAGIIDGCLDIAKIPTQRVSASWWKARMNVTRDKKLTQAAATEAFGTNKHWPLRKHDGLAEAALIALWGAREGRAKPIAGVKLFPQKRVLVPPQRAEA